MLRMETFIIRCYTQLKIIIENANIKKTSLYERKKRFITTCTIKTYRVDFLYIVFIVSQITSNCRKSL